MRVLLVRHGQTEWNADRVLQGQADVPLSTLGREQARALAPVVASLAPDRTVSSDLSRARETAELLDAPSLTLTADLRENDLGEWAGVRVDTLMEEDPSGYQAWRAGQNTPPGGEDWATFSQRTVGALNVATQGVRTLLVVSHGGVIRSLLNHYLDLSPSKIIPVGPGSLTSLRLSGDDVRLELFNYLPGDIVLDAPD